MKITNFLLCYLLCLPVMADSLLKRCPDKPNCVSSLAQEKPDNAIDALPLILDVATTRKILIDIIGNMSRTKLVTQEGNYLHFNFTSLIFRFVDDVEFEILDDKVNVRSASRIGYSDMGVNRKRVEEIRKQYLRRKQELKVL